MPDLQSDPNAPPSAEPPPSSTPQATPQAEPQAPPPSALEATGFKWGDEAPAYLRGRDARETLDIMDRLVTVAQQYASSVQAAPPQQDTPRTMTQNAPQIDQLDDDLLVTNPAEWRRRFAAQQQNAINTTVASVATPFAAQMADTVATLAKRDPANADVAAKWWTEVETMVAPIPAHMRTQALYDQAAKLARSNHLDEIANERAQRLAASGQGVEGVTRVTNADGTVSTVDAGGPVWDKIKASPLGSRMIERYGRNKVEQAAKAMGGLDKYAEMLAKSRTEFDPSHPSRMYSELL